MARTATIAMLSFRDRAWVDEALDSVLAQTVPCQLLISNDASGDGTFQRLRERLQDYVGPHRIDLLVEQPAPVCFAVAGSVSSIHSMRL